MPSETNGEPSERRNETSAGGRRRIKTPNIPRGVWVAIGVVAGLAIFWWLIGFDWITWRVAGIVIITTILVIGLVALSGMQHRRSRRRQILRTLALLLVIVCVGLIAWPLIDHGIDSAVETAMHDSSPTPLVRKPTQAPPPAVNPPSQDGGMLNALREEFAEKYATKTELAEVAKNTRDNTSAIGNLRTEVSGLKGDVGELKKMTAEGLAILKKNSSTTVASTTTTTTTQSQPAAPPQAKPASPQTQRPANRGRQTATVAPRQRPAQASRPVPVQRAVPVKEPPRVATAAPIPVSPTVVPQRTPSVMPNSVTVPQRTVSVSVAQLSGGRITDCPPGSIPTTYLGQPACSR